MNTNRFNSMMEIVRNKVELAIHVGKRPGDGAIRTVVKKLNLANVRFDSASAINTSGLVFSEGIALNALSCGGFV